MLNEKTAYTSPIWGQSPYTWAGGWTVQRMRRAIEEHDKGRFIESYAAAVKVTQWAQVFGALQQRIAPAQRLPRAVEGATEGLDGIVRQEAESLFVGERGELAPAFPSLWWTIWNHAMMGYAWWQCTMLPTPDNSTVIPHVTLWPSNATFYNQGEKKWYALTNEEGMVEIDPADPRWILIADGETDEHGNGSPWLSGAIRAVGPEFVEAIYAKDDRSDYADQHGRPKPIGILPDGVKVTDEQGKAAFETLKIIRESDAGGVFPHGMEVEQLESSPQTAALMKDIIEGASTAVAIAILGTDGTMSKGTGGVYSSPMFQGVAENRVAADVNAVTRGANRVFSIWRARNYPSAKPFRAVIRMPDTDRDARTKSLSERLASLHSIIKAERDNGCEVTQARVDELARQLDVPAPSLAMPTAPTAPAQAA